VPDI